MRLAPSTRFLSPSDPQFRAFSECRVPGLVGCRTRDGCRPRLEGRKDGIVNKRKGKGGRGGIRLFRVAVLRPSRPCGLAQELDGRSRQGGNRNAVPRGSEGRLSEIRWLPPSSSSSLVSRPTPALFLYFFKGMTRSETGHRHASRDLGRHCSRRAPLPLRLCLPRPHRLAPRLPWTAAASAYSAHFSISPFFFHDRSYDSRKKKKKKKKTHRTLLITRRRYPVSTWARYPSLASASLTLPPAAAPFSFAAQTHSGLCFSKCARSKGVRLCAWTCQARMPPLVYPFSIPVHALGAFAHDQP